MKSDSQLQTDVAKEEQAIAQALAAAGLAENAGTEKGLTYPLPASANIREIVAGYDSRTWGTEKVRCAICPQHQRHFKGFRVALDSGEQSRIGIDCGEKRFGKDAWKAASAAFSRRVEIATLQARVEPTVDALKLVTPLIAEWQQRTNRLAKWLGEFRREVPELANRLKVIAKQSEGRFETERMIWAESVNSEGRSVRRKEAEVSVVGRIPYPGMFLADTPTHGLNGATRALREAVSLFSIKITGLSLAKAFRAVQEARAFLVEADRAHAGALTNLDCGWLPALCEWANQDHDLTSRYLAKQSSIAHDEHGPEEQFHWLKKEDFRDSNLDMILKVWPRT